MALFDNSRLHTGKPLAGAGAIRPDADIEFMGLCPGPDFSGRAFLNHDCAGHSRCNQYTRLASKMDIRARFLNVRHKPTFGFSFDYFVSTQQK